MTGRIFTLDGRSNLESMEETAYNSEQVLQRLLASHPDLLAGDQIDVDDPRRWLLVSREMDVPAEEDGPGRWSLDHLFLDQDGIPTFVEVKKGSNTDVRRKVVGQMFDYAANAVRYWPVEAIRAALAARCEKAGTDPDGEVAALLADDQSVDEFWHRVKTNLQVGCVRLLFVADSIPSELRRVVEFLNAQMDPAEVLAVEVKQFVGSGRTTFVPRVIGQTEAARQRKKGATPAGKQWDESTFLAALRTGPGEHAARFAADLLQWITPKVSHVWYGRGARIGGVVPVIQRDKTRFQLLRMTTHGLVVFRLDWLRSKPPFDDPAVLLELLSRIGQIPGMQPSADLHKKRIPIPMKLLGTRDAADRLEAVISWMIETIEGAA